MSPGSPSISVQENLVKGPYLSIALPPKLAPEGGEPFPEVPLGFTPYRHQRIAHQRLDFGAAHGGRSTIVANGTGSGKTECFLWPIPDHCRRHAGEEGVKAILVYPMNALAFDQARRLAKVIHDTPALRGKVSAGLYVGEREKAPHTTMGRAHLVTDRRRCANARRRVSVTPRERRERGPWAAEVDPQAQVGVEQQCSTFACAYAPCYGLCLQLDAS